MLCQYRQHRLKVYRNIQTCRQRRRLQLKVYQKKKFRQQYQP
jgi:hypothetical protein